MKNTIPQYIFSGADPRGGPGVGTPLKRKERRKKERKKERKKKI